MANDTLGGSRRLVVGSESAKNAVIALADGAPNFAALTGLVSQALGSSANTRTAVRLPPILLLGMAGIGKTYIAEKIAHAISTDFTSIAMTNATAVNALGGTSAVWKKPSPGIAAKCLIEGQTANPLVVLDEIDKAFAMRGDADPLGPLHQLWEVQSASRFIDECLEMPMAMDSILWIATANSLEAIAPSLLDRMLILHIELPFREQITAILHAIYADVIAHFGDWFEAKMPVEIATALAKSHPRRAKRLLDIACGHAASRASHVVAMNDLVTANTLMKSAPARQRVGFLS